MAKKIVYRYDKDLYEEGEILTPKHDSFGMLTDTEKVVETAIRARLPNGQSIRGGSLFAWESEAVGKRMWPLSKKPYLYELEVDDADIRFRGDLNHYNNAKDAVKKERSPEEFVAAYCDGKDSDPAVNGAPRIELLFSKAKVLKRHS
ncbi:hypothetical protein ABIB06_001854 [Bradyrhizobium sp. LB8.2]|uniref:hypothetical protein n=1 Tax=Bradyrhizobium sp. LB8.2 TaxID=3156330 RepID=UPI003392C7B5